MPAVTELAAQLPFLLSVSPLFGALWTWLNGRRNGSAVRQAAITNATLTLALAIWMATQFALSETSAKPSAVHLASAFSWWSAPLGGDVDSKSATAISFFLAFGVDGLSVMPLLAIALVGWVAIVTADRCATPWTSASYVELLIGQSLALAIFAAQDFVMFVIGCELWAWWAFFAIGRQGGPERRTAALRWRVAAAAAHAAWSLAGIGCAVCHAWIQSDVRGDAAGVSWLLPEIVSRLARWISGNETALYAWTAFQPWVLPIWLIGLVIRWPVFPFHGWWSATLSEARAPIAALCSSAIVLQNGYALLRFVIPLFPPGGAGWAALLMMWVSLGTAYFGLLAVSQTELRRVIAAVSLFALHAAILGLLSGNVETCLAAWQSLVVTALALAGGCLLLGWSETNAESADAATVSGPALAVPRWFLLATMSLMLLGAGPVFALISGRAVIQLWEIRLRGLPNLMLLIGGLLAGWAVFRTVLRWGFGPIRPSERVKADLQGRELLIGIITAAALSVGVMPESWKPWVRPSFEVVHDPFAGEDAAAGAVHSSSNHRIEVTTERPITSPRPPEAEFFRRILAPLIWFVSGAVLLILPRRAGISRWGLAVSAVAFLGGLVAEVFDILSGGEVFWIDWQRAMILSLAAIGVSATVTRNAAANRGAWLIRLSVLGFAAGTGDLLFAGLAWEVAELARQFGAGESEDRIRNRERVRHAISSAAFWLGVTALLFLTGTTEFQGIADRLAELVPKNDGQFLGDGPRLGVAAVVLLLSGVGMRCGLLPWSFGCSSEQVSICDGTPLLDQWANQLLGLTLLLRITEAAQVAYGEPILVMLVIAGGITTLWAALRLTGELRVQPVLLRLLSTQFGGLVLVLAALGSDPTFPDSGLESLRSRELLLKIAAGGSLSVTLVVFGLVALLQRTGGPGAGELYFDHYRGMFSKRKLEAAVWSGLLLSLISMWPFATFWPRWLGLMGLVMLPQRLSEDIIRPHPVLLMGAAALVVAAVSQINVVARWLKCLAFDPPIAAFESSRNDWRLILAAIALAISLTGGVCPRWLGS